MVMIALLRGYGLVQLMLVTAPELLPVAVYPNEVVTPPPRVPLEEAFLTVIAPLVPVFTPFHRLLMVWPLARVIFTVQPLTVDEPLFLTFTLALKPPCQLLVTE